MHQITDSVRGDGWPTDLVREREAEFLDELAKFIKGRKPARDFGNFERTAARIGCQHRRSLETGRTAGEAHPSRRTRLASRIMRIQSVPIRLRQHTTASTISPPAVPPGSGTDEHSASTT